MRPSLGAITLSLVLGWTSPAWAAPNVVVVLVDALRADRLGTYGHDPEISPRVDAFASQAVVFENTVSQNAWTVPSVASIFSGVDPQAHRVLQYDGGKMDTLSLEHDSLAEQFQAAGYTTAAFLKSKVIESSRGFDQGFGRCFGQGFGQGFGQRFGHWFGLRFGQGFGQGSHAPIGPWAHGPR
ncbi:MAG: sulfatase-like hydrolase/transferase, partial [Myxococcota bacterium]|nr:sulfatase-like hydrolase/transferase [Myxococcota bacterium]